MVLDRVELVEHALTDRPVTRCVLKDQVNGCQAELEEHVGGIKLGTLLEAPFRLLRILSIS